MPEQRLERTRRAYDGYRYWPPMRPAEQRDTPEGATLFVRGRTYAIGETVFVKLPDWHRASEAYVQSWRRPESAAYRITQAQKAHDDGT